MINKAIFCLLLGIVCARANAVQTPKTLGLDKRVKVFMYHESEVYSIRGYYLHNTLVEFSDRETILHVVGSSGAMWEVTPVGRSAITLKPFSEMSRDSNISVVTSKRTYHFELLAARFASSSRSGSITFGAKFRYPDEEKRIQDMELAKKEALIGDPQDPNRLNYNYSFAGDYGLRPVTMYDNGDFTYIQFREKSELPAIYIVNPDGKEQLVNARREGRFMVVPRVTYQFSFRIGQQLACVRNEKYSEYVLKSAGFLEDTKK